MNGFPSHIFDQLVRRFLNNILEPKPNVYTVLKKMVISAFLLLADTLFEFEPKSLDFVTLLISILIRFVFRSSTRVSYFFPFNYKVPKFLKSGVVYLFKCRCCSTSYVGQTTRHLHTRVSEHLGIFPITGRPSSSPVMSSILSHLNSAGHSANFHDFKTLSTCSETYELMIHESLLISQQTQLNPFSMYKAAQFPSTFYNSTVSCPFFVPLSVLFLLCTTLYPLIPHLSWHFVI